MLVISEQDARALVSVEDAIAVVEKSFAAMARGFARNYPVVRELVGYQDAVYGVKTGCDTSAPLLGLKAGGYWPHNLAKGLTNHQSSTVLFDPETGRASALVSANYLTGVRTGAASAIATKYLSRPDSSVLGIIGTGVQSAYQLRATLAVRPVRTVYAWDPSPENLVTFGRTVAELGLAYAPQTDCQAVAANADILITVTPSQRALVEKSWVRPGTHISAMGADTKGKQELEAALVACAALFVDEAAQAITIGECQHAFNAGLITEQSLRGSLGAVIAGLCEGRRSAQEITLFDGTGVALQDLVVADLAVRLAAERGLGCRVAY
ncbi:MAG: ornithine cyclodeaminase family protein [Rhodoferax sp.]|uniref:ornithine cyclodeaminase family protein n=2 Tax=Rhodoferax sp. TaxID=50421 RepID=UPI0027165859|nr:ornithine cyclodeaminase family protein [Rhodoferax sp.]MDO9145968.1 ornithine cyclodeaminase family protein [Rhodoferax sp.]MDP1531940.1 ornithine cyclodeaminase family protein [Rhodoferax sp.]MDP1945855.1 ornithine cyclodeaminase family protein [Rhodoferax sp.]MDP3193563.1 ornithine cyclodeaminase family protein [Rhodoferax sp.]MDP3866426.1 ornithine cyclodeaminase family protein [Rhodoferax sp.]